MEQEKNRKKGPLLWAMIGILGFSLLLPKTASASDIPIEVYVTGQLTMSLAGGWSGGISFPTAPIMDTDLTLGWTSNSSNDYIEYADDTSTAGFHITMSMTDFSYNGGSQTQGALPAGNFKLVAKYANGQTSTGTIGTDDPTKNVSIAPTSCAGATPETYTLHSDFTSSGTNYSTQGSSASKVLVQSTANCTNLGHLRFDRATLLLPQNSALGSYSSTITLTIVDGQP